MEVMIKSCPACSAVVIGDELVCAECGKALPTEAESRAGTTRTLVSPEELHCPKCHANVPRGVLRCRDCGAYMDPNVEAAALARQFTRGFSTPGMGGGAFGGGSTFGPGFNPTQVGPNSNFAEVANDDDFDLTPDMNLLDTALQTIVQDQGTQRMTGMVAGSSEDDFEMGSGGAAEEYAVSDVETPDEPAAPELPASVPESTEAEIETASAAPPATSMPHSMETGGDVILDAALAEERAAVIRQKSGGRRVRRSTSSKAVAGRFRVYCPNGHRIEVQDRHRGRTGRCPNCKAIFFVPLALTAATAGEAGGAVAATEETPPKLGYSRWITDVHLHRVNPSKLKLKPGSLYAEYDSVDLGVSPENMLLATMYSGRGTFRAMLESKKKPVTRQAMLEHFSTGMPLADLAIKHLVLTPDLMQQFRMVQPAVPGEESLFADVPVFGVGRIAIRLPAADAAGERAYLSFSLSQFREFSVVLAESFGLTEFGSGTGIPMEDSAVELTCHYSETVLRSLPPETLPYYKNDTAIKLQLLGRRCVKCGIVVSEDSRKKEKIGGKSDASIAKAKCPKCKQKFGDITLYGLPTPQ